MLFAYLVVAAMNDSQQAVAQMWTFKRVSVVLAVGVVCLFILTHGPFRRSSAGRICRFMLGYPLQSQLVDDLADDVRSIDDPSRLNAWADDMMDRYRRGELTTNSTSASSVAIRNVVPTELFPSWLPSNWGSNVYGGKFEVVVCCDEDGHPLGVCCSVHGGGYLADVCIMGNRSRDNAPKPTHDQEPVPGVFVQAQFR